jgi:hypothetical protein
VNRHQDSKFSQKAFGLQEKSGTCQKHMAADAGREGRAIEPDKKGKDRTLRANGHLAG